MSKISPLSISLRLFHAQSLLGFVSFNLPFDKDCDELRSALFNAAMAICKCSDLLSKMEGEEPYGKEV